jgi:hypothetical protein
VGCAFGIFVLGDGSGGTVQRGVQLCLQVRVAWQDFVSFTNAFFRQQGTRLWPASNARYSGSSPRALSRAFADLPLCFSWHLCGCLGVLYCMEGGSGCASLKQWRERDCGRPEPPRTTTAPLRKYDVLCRRGGGVPHDVHTPLL